MRFFPFDNYIWSSIDAKTTEAGSTAGGPGAAKSAEHPYADSAARNSKAGSTGGDPKSVSAARVSETSSTMDYDLKIMSKATTRGHCTVEGRVLTGDQREVVLGSHKAARKATLFNGQRCALYQRTQIQAG